MHREGSSSREILIAPAKLTLTLRVTGVRDTEPFRGYHLIDAVMTLLDLHDLIEIEELPSDSPSRVVYTGPFADGLGPGAASGTDLVSRALHAVGRSANVNVIKNIPHGGGLGGGSADAAAILRWAHARRHDPGRRDFDLDSVAVALGADVVFCASGLDRARVRGIGELLEPLEQVPGSVTLIVPPFSVSTPAVYRALDQISGDQISGDQQSGDRTSVAAGHATARHTVNDLEEAAIRVEPRLADWKLRITAASGISPTLAGSGATWFVPGDHGYLTTRLPEATVVVTGHR